MTEADVQETSTPTAVLDAPTPEPQTKGPTSDPVNGYWWGTGRRKTAIARVRVRLGNGRILINGKEVDRYFGEARDRAAVRAPLQATECQGRLDVFARVSGGGYAGQAGAVVLGLARALKVMDSSLEGALRDGGYLTRDARMTERKKYGRRGARRSFQFSKR